MSDEEKELVNEEGDIIPPNQPAPQKPGDDEEAQPTEPYDFDHCTIQISITLLPKDDHVDGRPVVIGVRNHQDTPLFLMTRSFPLGPLPQAVGDLLERLRAEMPARQKAHDEAEAKKKADAEARAEAARQRAAQVRAKVAEQKAQPVAPAKKAPIVPDFGDDDNSQPAAPAAQANLLENV